MRSIITGGAIYINHHLLGMEARDERGRFKRTRTPFSLENFNEGYVDVNGRFKVWTLENPRSNKNGYTFRSIVAYTLYHDTPVPEEYDIHHKDENRLNDSKENLEMLPHGEHTALHRRMPEINRICKHCKKEFLIKKWRLKDPKRGQYCSQKCYHSHKRTDVHKKRISEALKQAYNEGRR